MAVPVERQGKLPKQGWLGGTPAFQKTQTDIVGQFKSDAHVGEAYPLEPRNAMFPDMRSPGGRTNAFGEFPEGDEINQPGGRANALKMRTESQPSGEHTRPGCGFRRPAEKCRKSVSAGRQPERSVGNTLGGRAARGSGHLRARQRRRIP